MVMKAWFAALDPAFAADFPGIDRKAHPYCADITLLHAFMGRDRQGAAARLPYYLPTHHDDLATEAAEAADAVDASEAADTDATTARGPRHGLAVSMKHNIAAALLWKRISPTDDRRRAAEAFCRNMQAEQRQLTAEYDRALAKACLEEKATALCHYATQIAAYPVGVGLHDSMSSACAAAKDSPHWAAYVAEAARLG
ncbi:hypothetical protein M885DRAFT_569980 [Pelagophyceae sp. CCMP2097]|nr:hypothetical protein M885DRAFT_569980 [Pelagophyceae sp. CCMP2097]